MDRRGFVNMALRAAAAASWVSIGGMLRQTRLVSAVLPGAPAEGNAKARKLIIPTDTPDRFKVKVMEFNPIPAPNTATWQLEIGGLVHEPVKLRASDLTRLPTVDQSSRLKCVQCWSARISWHGFRAGELFKLVRPLPKATWARVDCADLYYDYLKMEDLLHPRTLFARGMNGEPLTPEHGAPLRLVIPFKYGYKSSKLITKITLIDHGGQGVVADTWPYYSQSGDIEPGYDHPFDFPGMTKKISGGEITDY